MQKYILIITLLLSVALVSCKKEEDNTLTPGTSNSKVIVYSNLDAESANHAGRFNYFRLSDSAIVAFSDSNSNKWDIAFNSTRIRINNSSSGPGLGGAIVVTGKAFDDVITAPDGGYGIDTASTKLAITASSGKGWYNYNPATNIITPIPGNILVIRTADGKYAKVEIINYYKNAPAALDTTSIPRYYKFKYFYQADGSKKLQ